MITEAQQKYEYSTLELQWYIGSLDFPCDFCGNNSYRNFHVSKNKENIVICKDCLNKAEEIGSLTENEK